MNRKVESFFVYVLCLIFVIGSALFLLKFYTQQDPNFYAHSIFLIAILVLILFHDKLEEFLFSKEGVKVKMKRAAQEIQKTRSYEQEKEVFEKAYETEQEIKEGV